MVVLPTFSKPPITNLSVFSFAITVFVSAQSTSVFKLADISARSDDATNWFDGYHEAGICQPDATGSSYGEQWEQFCCSETCHPQYPGLYRLVCFQFFSRIYSAKATSMQSAVFSAIILPNESAMYILTISSSCCNVCWNTSNSVPAVAAKKTNASDPLNWRAMVLPTEKTVLLLCVEKVFCSGLRVGMVSCIGLTVGGWMLCTLKSLFFDIKCTFHKEECEPRAKQGNNPF